MTYEQQVRITYEKISLMDLVFFDELTDFDIAEHGSDIVPYLPLLVTKQPMQDKYVIIDGNKRLYSLKNKGIEECLCGVAEADSVKQRGLMRIKLNSNRSLSLSEKYLFSKWMKENCTVEEYRDLFSLLGINEKGRYNFEQLMAATHDVVEAVLRGYVDIANVSELNLYEKEDVDSVLELFSQFQFSRQTQRELLEWFPELSFRLKKSIQELISDPELNTICDDKKLNGPQKIKKIRDYCFELRFPTLSSAKKNWNVVASNANPDPNSVSFNPSEAFERNVLEIKIKITDANRAQTVLKQLADIPLEKWESLIYPALLYHNKKF